MNSDRRADANIKLRSHSVHDPVTNSRAWGAGNQQQDGRPFWFQRRPSALSVETTGYALLAQIKLRELTYAAEIANWLSTQQNYGGGFVSTQDTVIALQSLSEFSALTVGGDLNLHCNISSANGFKTIFRLENEDTLLQKTVEVTKENIRDRLFVETQGEGTGTLNVEVKYNENSNDRRELCPFDMVISTRRINTDQDPDEEIRYLVGDELLINIEVSYLGDTNTSMGIIDFGLFTGFTPNKTSCEKVVKENSFVARYEVSDRSVIFYTDYFPIQREGSISFEFQATCAFNVTNIHHAAVRVYDYYDPDEECIQFYTGEGSNVVQTLCNDDECTCISMYHLQVTNIREEDGYKVVNATILDPIKRGDERDVHMHDSREFWLSRACRCPDIRIRQYLLIGSNTLEYTKPDGNGAVKGALAISPLNTSKGIVNLVAAYAPTLAASPDVKNKFYSELDELIGQLPESEDLYLLGDFNARVGAEHDSWPTCVGHHGVGKINENGQRLLELCCNRNLCITNTYFQHKEKHKVSWMHPRSHQWHQLDLIITKRSRIGDVHTTRSYHSADCDTDHALVISKVVLQPKRIHHAKPRGLPKINTACTADTVKTHKFNASMKNFGPLFLMKLQNQDGVSLAPSSTSQPLMLLGGRKDKTPTGMMPT
ncbi:complement component 3-2 [Apostichopus japonicus]|uniref:Complement component 3-2 n=1 Tax=Stichopus japonicus TaxID=307972 RepID=A0A2G8K7J3_STIJA|nr:complement component 3-2 [Apostichopus japonicus]